MRYRITNLSRDHKKTGEIPLVADLDMVQAALEKAAALGERLYIRPVEVAEAG